MNRFVTKWGVLTIIFTHFFQFSIFTFSSLLLLQTTLSDKNRSIFSRCSNSCYNCYHNCIMYEIIMMFFSLLYYFQFLLHIVFSCLFPSIIYPILKFDTSHLIIRNLLHKTANTNSDNEISWTSLSKFGETKHEILTEHSTSYWSKSLNLTPPSVVLNGLFLHWHWLAWHCKFEQSKKWSY